MNQTVKDTNIISHVWRFFLRLPVVTPLASSIATRERDGYLSPFPLSHQLMACPTVYIFGQVMWCFTTTVMESGDRCCTNRPPVLIWWVEVCCYNDKLLCSAAWRIWYYLVKVSWPFLWPWSRDSWTNHGGSICRGAIILEGKSCALISCSDLVGTGIVFVKIFIIFIIIIIILCFCLNPIGFVHVFILSLIS